MISEAMAKKGVSEDDSASSLFFTFVVNPILGSIEINCCKNANDD